MANDSKIAYDKSDLRDVYKAFKLMDDQAADCLLASSGA